jgi:5-methyltetrahydrofolate--homocysteine methyltransferase
MNQIDILFQAVVDGNEPDAVAGAQACLQAKIPADQVMRESLIGAMTEVGRRFEAGEYYLPDLVISARAMKSALPGENRHALLRQGGHRSRPGRSA